MTKVRAGAAETRETANAGTLGEKLIELNGEPRKVVAASALDLLRSLEIDPRTVVLELNRQVVRRTELESTAINEGDRVELVHFVGGG
jgi:thiamine biosynthesis protein ThiS